ncbi:MAG: hypothetical protein ACHQK9_00545 [Reyranellales bacterium]
MPKAMVVVAALALAMDLGGAVARAQGVAPGGGIGNSTGIGSGLGGVVGGTGPSYPNGTTQPTLGTPPPPGGVGAPAGLPPVSSVPGPSAYPSPSYSFEHKTPRLPTETLRLPQQPAGDLSFLKGCWRTEVFRYARQAGTSTYCFDGRGVGKFLYVRLDQPNFSCSAPVQARYVGQQLRLQNLKTTCSDGSDVFADTLDCLPAAGDSARCSGAAALPEQTESWTVRLYRLR